MFTNITNPTQQLWVKYSLITAVTLFLLFFALVTPVSAADDPATPLNVTTTVNAPFVTIAWTSTVEAQYGLYRSATGQLADAVETNAPLLSSVNVDSPEIHYSFVDTVTTSGVTYSYWIVNKDAVQRNMFGPYNAAIPQKLYFALVSRL